MYLIGKINFFQSNYLTCHVKQKNSLLNEWILNSQTSEQKLIAKYVNYGSPNRLNRVGKEWYHPILISFFYQCINFEILNDHLMLEHEKIFDLTILLSFQSLYQLPLIFD
ncbi:hypothetical protein BpHYR1_030631 [Brachionus plicatilis]|uniref:Uncharacterized protein n=1 Tax=Brachionus plicatilis TaxID=10195 RepID=A0A3M7RDK0_BRAPC|nr:hypothetical protein BpHYR1_030631 [Brachionus plicatilis]